MSHDKRRPITERQIAFVTNVTRTARMEFTSKEVFLLAIETAWVMQEQAENEAEHSANTELAAAVFAPPHAK